jgi:hypothetical protein
VVLTSIQALGCGGQDKIGTLRGGHLVVSVGRKSQDLNWLPYAPLGGRREATP